MKKENKRVRLSALFLALIMGFSVSVIGLTASAEITPDDADEGYYGDNGFDDNDYGDDDFDDQGAGDYSDQDLDDDGTGGGYDGYDGDNDINPDEIIDTDPNAGDTDPIDISEDDPTPTPKPSPSATPKATPTASPSATPTASPSISPSPTATAKATATPKDDDFQVIGHNGDKITNAISANLSTIGLVVIGIGVVGIICLILVSIFSKRRGKDEAEEIYETVGNAAREDKRRANGQKKAGGKSQAGKNAAKVGVAAAADKSVKTKKDDQYSYDDNYAYVSAKGRTAQKPVKTQKAAAGTKAEKPSAPVQRQYQRGTQNAPAPKPSAKKKPTEYSTADIDNLLNDVFKND